MLELHGSGQRTSMVVFAFGHFLLAKSEVVDPRF